MTVTNRLMIELEETIYSKVLEVIRLLRESNRRIVLAESCTGGLASAWFTSVPGASDVFCGSMVVYRNDTKSQWLGLEPQMLADEKIGPVSPQASEQLAREVLSRTPEAHLAIGITGHLGPNAPLELNRKIFLVGLIRRAESGCLEGTVDASTLQWSWEYNLEKSRLFFKDIFYDRKLMQSLAVFEALCFTLEMLES